MAQPLGLDVFFNQDAQGLTDRPRRSGSAAGAPLDEALVGTIASAEGLNPTQQRVMTALLQQESGYGRNTSTSVNGAQGAGQIIPDTFRRYAKPGERIDNPEHNLAVMARIVKDLGAQTGDDPARIATGYFSGAGNIAREGTQAWKNDAADGNGKRVSGYVTDVVGRLGSVPEPAQPAQAAGPDLAKAPAWAAVKAKPEFLSLSKEDKAAAKQAYFDYWIAPNGGDDALRQKFMAAEDAAAPDMFQKAWDAASTVGEAVAGGVKSMFTKPESVMKNAGQVPTPEGVTESLAPMTPQQRRAIENAYNASTPEQRLQMGRQPGFAGQYVTELNQRYGLIDQRASPTIDKVDPRAEKRAQRLMAEGLDPEIARNMAPTQARMGTMPGQEIPGTIGATEYDFETNEAFKNTPGLNNPLVRGLAKGGLGMMQGYAGVGEAMADLAFGSDPNGAKSSKWARGKTEAIGEGGSFLERNLEGAISSLGQQLPLLIAGAATGGAAIPLAGMAMQSFGQEYSEGKAKGLDPGSSAARAGIFAAFEVIGESFGLGGVLKQLKLAGKGIADPSELAKFFASNLKKEIPGELLTTTGQFLTDKIPSFGLNQEAGLAEYLKQVGDTVTQTVMQGGIMAGGTTGLSKASQFLRQGDTSSDEGRLAGTLNDAVDSSNWAKSSEQAGMDAFARGPASSIEMRLPGVPNAPIPQIPGLSSPQVTPDGRLEAAPPAAPPVSPLQQSADTIVEQLANQAGIPRETVLPTAPAAPAAPTAPQGQPPATDSFTDEDVLGFAQTRLDALTIKRDGERVTTMGETGPVDQTVPGVGLTAAEQAEIDALERAMATGQPQALRDLYGLNDQAPAVAPNVPPVEPNVPPVESEADREARLEREAIQNEPPVAEAAQDETDFPLPGEALPRTEKEARERRANNQQEPNATQREQVAGQATPAQGPQDGAGTAAPAPGAQDVRQPGAANERLIDSLPLEDNTEIQVIEQPGGITVRVFDKDAGQPAPGVRVFPKDREQDAFAYAVELAAKSTPKAPKTEKEAKAKRAEGKWFGTEQKAKDFIAQQGIANTHEVFQNNNRFEIRKKEASSATPTGQVATQDVRPEGDQPTGDAGVRQGAGGSTGGAVVADPGASAPSGGTDQSVRGAEPKSDGALDQPTGAQRLDQRIRSDVARKEQEGGAPGAGYTRRVFRGSGRKDKGSVYNGGSTPILGDAAYYALDEKTAAKYGPDIESRDVSLRNPLVIDSDEKWRALTREAGWQLPVPARSLNEDAKPAVDALQKVVRDRGHDGVVIDFDPTYSRDILPDGRGIKTLRNVFGDPQVVVFDQAQKASKPNTEAAETDAGAPKPKTEKEAKDRREQVSGDDAKNAKAKADLEAALGDLGDILGKGARLNITPEQEQKLIPVLTRVMDAAFRLGYYKFKDAARFVLKTIRERLGNEAADQISLDHLQGSYIGMAGKYQSEGASSKKEVIAVESLDDLAQDDAQPVEKPATPPQKNSPNLSGRKITFDVLVEDTGQTAQVTVDAAREDEDLTARESAMRELIDCLRK